MKMTDKQLMIDGVDVSGCVQFTQEGDCCNLGGGCKGWPNCYYKQLARKTQELETICRTFDIEYGYDEETGAIVGRCNKLIEKEKVVEEYKQSLDEKNKFLQDLGISASGEFKRIKFYIENLKNKYDEKVKECEELEEKLNAQFTEMEEKLTAEELKNYELKEKLRIALSSLNDIATIDNYIVAQVDAQQALFMISEVENEIK